MCRRYLRVRFSAYVEDFDVSSVGLCVYCVVVSVVLVSCCVRVLLCMRVFNCVRLVLVLVALSMYFDYLMLLLRMCV